MLNIMLYSFFFPPKKFSEPHTLRICGFSFMLYFNTKFTFLKEVLEGQEGQTQFHQELLAGSEVFHPSRVLASSVLLASAAFWCLRIGIWCISLFFIVDLSGFFGLPSVTPFRGRHPLILLRKNELKNYFKLEYREQYLKHCYFSRSNVGQFWHICCR